MQLRPSPCCPPQAEIYLTVTVDQLKFCNIARPLQNDNLEDRPVRPRLSRSSRGGKSTPAVIGEWSMERSSCTSSSRRATWHGSCEGCTRTGGGSGRRAAARTSEATSRAAKCCRRHTCMLLHARGASHACGAPHAAHACGAGGACSAPAKQANGDAAMCARAGACARAFGLLDVGAELFIRDCDGRLTARMKKHEGTARHAWACSRASRTRTGARGEGRDGEREAHNLTARRLSACPTATTRPAREEGGEAESGKGRRRQLRAVEVHSTDHGENAFRLWRSAGGPERGSCAQQALHF